MIHGSRLRTVDDLIRRSFGISDQGQIDFLRENRNAPRRKTLMQKEFVGQRYKPWQRFQRAQRDHWFDTQKLQKYLTVYQDILKKPQGLQQEFFKILLAHSKDEQLVQLLLKEPFPRELLHLASTKQLDLLHVAKNLARY